MRLGSNVKSIRELRTFCTASLYIGSSEPWISRNRMKKLLGLEGSFGSRWMGNALIGSLINVEGRATGKAFFLRFFRVEGSRRGGGAMIPGAVDCIHLLG